MKNLEIKIDNKKCHSMAREIFLQISGLYRQGKKYDRMCDTAFKTLDHLEQNIDIRYVCKYSNDLSFDGGSVSIDGTVLNCKAFEQIDPESVEGAFIYAVSAGDFYLPDAKVTEQVYADIWGTAYTDSIRTCIKNKLENITGLSDNFGPGFYGMNVEEIGKMNDLIDFNSIGIKLKNSKLMVPVKSCAGIYFKVNDKYEELSAACISCKGNYFSCRLCQINGGL